MSGEDDKPESETFDAFLRDLARADPKVPPQMETIVGAVLGHYEIGVELGRGGMGVVHVARDTRLGRSVALKLLPTSVGVDGQRRRRFLREAQAAAASNHPNIATVYEVGEVDGRLFIAMELIEGRTLRSRLDEGPLTAEEACRIGRQIALGFVRAHEKGIVHRDLKPENVMLLQYGAVKILDFGLAKLRVSDSEESTSTLTEEGRVLGTPGYMSPEQATGKRGDERTDIYAFGVVLHEMLTGELPGGHASGKVIAERAVREVVARCLAQRSESRWASFADVVSALEALPGAGAGSLRVGFLAPWRDRASHTSWRWGVASLLIAALAYGFLRVVALRSATETTLPHADPGSAPTSPVVSKAFNERRMSASDESIINLRLSPDGETVAYTARSPDSAAAVFTHPVYGGDSTPVFVPSSARTSGRVTLAGYFPDGSLALVAGTADDTQAAVWRVGAEKAPNVIGHVRSDYGWVRLSPDGSRLLVGRGSGLYVETLAVASSVRISEDPQWDQSESDTDWSPAGDRILHTVHGDNGGRALEITSADGRSTRNVISIVPNSMGMAALAWPEPHRLLVTTRRPSGSVLSELDIDDQGSSVGAPRDLYVWSDAQLRGLSSTKGILAFIKVHLRSEVFTGSLSLRTGLLASPLAALTADDAEGAPVGWLNDQRLAFSSNREQPGNLYARAIGTTPAALLARGVADPRVMMTGDLLAWKDARADAGGPCALVRIDAAGEHPLFSVTAGESGMISCRTRLRCVRGPAAARCIGRESVGESSEWFPVDLETGLKGTTIYTAGQVARAWDLSPIGDTIAFTVEGSGMLNYISVASGVMHQARIWPAFQPQFVVYTPDGRGLVVTGMDEEADRPYILASLDLAGHARLIATTRDAWLFAPTLSSDGTALAVAERQFPTALAILEPR